MSTLQELQFSDLLVHKGGAFLKGAPGGRRLEPLSRELCADLDGLFDDLEKVQRKEFGFCYNGVRYRVSRIDTVDGLWFALRRGVELVPNLEELGFSSAVRNLLCSSRLGRGLILFSGAMGSGKTTSASALVKSRLELYGGHAVTLEDPPELPLQGEHGDGYCLQKGVNDFGQALIEALRYGSPEIIYLGELRAPNDVSQALRAAVNGHLLVATIHAGSVMEAAQRLLSLGSAIDDREMTLSLMSSGLGLLSINDSSEMKKLQLEWLSVRGEEDQAVRSLIGSGKLNQLGSAILEQRNRILISGGSK